MISSVLGFEVEKSGDVTKYYNEVRVSNSIETIRAEKVGTIPSGTTIGDLTIGEIEIQGSVKVNGSGEMIFYNKSNEKLVILDDKLNLKREFLSIGSGPGELSFFASFFFGSKDSIYVPSISNQKVMKFSPDGYFQSDINLDESVPFKIDKIGNNFIGYSEMFINVGGEGYQKLNNLSLFNSEFNKVKSLYFNMKSIKSNGGTKLSGSTLFYSIDYKKEIIYISKPNSEKYIVDIIDFNGKNIGEIHRKFRKIRYTDSELEKINSTYDMEENGKKLKHTYKYKDSISDMFLSSGSDLWVKSAIDGSRGEIGIYDVFRDGKLLKKVYTDGLFPSNEKLNGGVDAQFSTIDDEGNINIYKIE
jgi:hypothetical protein